MGEVLHNPECLGLRRGENVGNVGHRGGRHADAGQPLMPVLRIVLREVRLEERDELSAVRDPLGVRAKAGVDELDRPEHVAEAREETVVPGGDHQLAVAGANTSYGATSETGALTPWHGSVGEVSREVVAHVADRGLVKRDVDERPTPASRVEERRENSQRRHVPVPWSINDEPTRTPGCPARP